MTATAAKPRMKVSARDLFETTSCRRCDGSGHVWNGNAVDGTRCYGCGGTGWKLTANGTRAREQWVALWTRHVRHDELKPGDRVMVAGVAGREMVHVVSESGPDPLNPGRWQLRFEKSAGCVGGFGGFPSSTFRVPVSQEEKFEAYQRIAHLKGALGWPMETATEETS